MSEWSEDQDRLDPDERRWPMAPTDLLPRERWRWWEQLWSDVLALGDRYRLRPGNGWWEQPIVVEALAALAAWVERYDSSAWDDPPGKLGLLYDVERVRELIGGGEPFYPRSRPRRVRQVPDRRGLPAATSYGRRSDVSARPAAVAVRERARSSWWGWPATASCWWPAGSSAWW